jgi:AraC family transcriptional regulator
MLDTWLETTGVKVERCTISPGAHFIPATPFHRLGIHLGKSVNASCRCDDQQHVRVQSHGDIDIVPAGLDGEWIDDGECTILRLWLSPALLHRAAEDLDLDPARFALKPKFQHRNARIEHIALALEAQFDPAGRHDTLVTDTLARALALQLIGSEAIAVNIPGRQTLTHGQRRRLVEFVESHLDRDLSLAQLARIAGVSISHLKALFPRSFGVPVHQYVIRRRVERAKDLILAGQLPLSEIALISGFSHQSHMARMMKRILGATPSELLRAVS